MIINIVSFCRISDCFDQNQFNNVKDIWENFYFGRNHSLKDKTSYTYYWGKLVFLRKNYALSNKDYLRIHFDKTKNFYAIDLHDKNFHIDGSEQFVDFKRVQVKLENGLKKIIWLKIEQIILLPELSYCNNEEHYSFLECSKVHIQNTFV